MTAKGIRAALAMVVTLFERPQFRDAPALAPPTHAAEQEGLVSPASAFRIRTAFSRFARMIGGGG